MPICFRAPLFGLFSAIYGVKIEEATRRYSEYRTFTDSTIDCVKGRSYRLDEFMIGVIGDDGDQDTASRVDKVKKNHPGVEGLLKSVRERGN